MKTLFIMLLITGSNFLSYSADAFEPQSEPLFIQSSDIQMELESNSVTEIQVYLPSQNKVIPMRCCKPHGCCSPLDPFCC